MLIDKKLARPKSILAKTVIVMTRNNLCIISISGRPIGIGLSTWAVDKKLLDTEKNQLFSIKNHLSN